MANNNNQTMVLAADIGSTRTRLAAVGARDLSCADRIDFDNTDFDERFIPAVRKIIAANPLARVVNISSCVKSLADKAKYLCETARMFDSVRIISAQGDKILFIGYDMKCDALQIKYDDPQTLGTDRLCNAAACAALYPHTDCVIIDAGTAITVDILRGGKFFEGGAILPGLSMQLRSLHSGTDGLPLVDLDDGRVSPVGTSTADCIRSGVLYGTAGAIEKHIGECQKILGNNNTKVIATGGGWGVLNLLASQEITRVPDLTLIGAGIVSFKQ